MCWSQLLRDDKQEGHQHDSHPASTGHCGESRTSTEGPGCLSALNRTKLSTRT